MLNTSLIPAVIDPVSREIFFEQPNGSLVELDGSVWTVEFKMPKNFSQRDSESKPFGPDDYTVEVNYTQKEPVLLADSDESYTSEIGASDFSEVEGDDKGYVHFKWTPPSQAALYDGWLWFAIRVYDGDGHTWSTKAKKIRVWPAIQGSLIPVPGDSTDPRRLAVLYTEQDLSEAQKAIARTNIGLGDILTKSFLFRGQITTGSLNDYRDNGWWVIATDDRPNISDVPDGANNICYLFSYTTGTGATYQIFKTVFGQEWTRRINASGTASSWHQSGYSTTTGVARERFIELMNRKAARLGMQDTLYDNTSFIISTPPSTNYTSVKDILRLAVAANSSRVFKEYFGLESATIYTGDETTPTITLKNLLASPGRTGVGYHFPTEIVSSLPAVGTAGTTYLIQTSSDPISYDEYMYLDGAFTKISTTKDPLKPHTIIGSLFQRLKDIGFTVVGAKSGSRSYSTENEVDTIFNIACVAYDETYDETYAVAILDADSVVRLYDATVEAFAYARYRAHTSDYENPPVTTNMLSTGVKAVSGCRIVSNSLYFGNEHKNVASGFLFEEQTEKDFVTGLAPGESSRNPYIQVSASVYKIMCVLVAEDTIGNWNSEYLVSSFDAGRLGSGKNLKTGYVMTIEDLAIDMALVSSNQATCCIATYCGGKMLYSNYVGT